MLAFGGMSGDTEIPEDPVTTEEGGKRRFLIVLCIGSVPILAVFCCWEFTQPVSTWINSVPTGCLATAERVELRRWLNVSTSLN